MIKMSNEYLTKIKEILKIFKFIQYVLLESGTYRYYV